MKDESSSSISDFDPSPSSTSASPSFCPPQESLYRRRFANDPDMMHELHRYRRLMLLTILPTISSETSEPSPSLHPHAHVHSKQITPTPPIETNNFQRTSVKSTSIAPSEVNELEKSCLPTPEFFFDEDFDSRENEAMSKPLTESMLNFSHLGADGGTSDHLSRSVGCLGNGSTANGAARKQIKSANSETRLPTPGKGVTASESTKNETKKLRRVSIIQGHGGEQAGLASPGNAQIESDTSELDLLTLSGLYLESRHRVFGDEWHQRQASLTRYCNQLVFIIK